VTDLALLFATGCVKSAVAASHPGRSGSLGDCRVQALPSSVLHAPGMAPTASHTPETHHNRPRHMQTRIKTERAAC